MKGSPSSSAEAPVGADPGPIAAGGVPLGELRAMNEPELMAPDTWAGAC